MLRTLAFIIFFASILPVNGKEKSPKPGTDQYAAKADLNSPPPPAKTAQCTVMPDDSSIECKWSKDEPHGYLARLFTAENTPNIALFLVGLAGVLAAVRTLRLIKAQVSEMRLQRCVMQDTVDVMRRQSELLSDTTQRELRAYVSVDSAVLKFTQPEVPRIRVVFKNFGQTPAHNFSGWIHTWLADYPLHESLPVPPRGWGMGCSVLGPGAIADFVAPEKPPIEGDDLRDLGTASCTLFAYGEIRYHDIFGKPRFTKYRLMYGGPEKVRGIPQPDGVRDWVLVPDVEGNEAD